MDLRSYKFYKEIKIPIKMITDMANATGFPSLWADIFRNYPEIVKAIYESFFGTDMKCFDSQMKPLRGIKGKL